MATMTGKFRFDPITILCCLLCSATFLFWLHAVGGGIHIAAVLFLIVLPATFFCLGDSVLCWLRFPVRSAHPFPLAFLLGSVLAALLLFFAHLVLPIPLRLIFAALFLVSLATFILAPARDSVRETTPSSWKVVVAVVLALAAASLWTQELRPGMNISGDSVVVHPYIDSIAFAEFVSQLHDDETLPHLGDPDMAGFHVPIYHYASYLLPASLEAWSPTIDAFDTTVAFWIPFSFVLLGLAAFCLASEWLGELAGVAGLCAVLLVPSPPAYLLPVYYLSFHWLLAVSPGLTYGVAGAAAGLVLLSGALRSNRTSLFVAGFGLILATVFLKAHIALVALPLSVLWVVTFKEGWSRRRRLVLLLALTISGCAALLVMDHLKIGPNILPNGSKGNIVARVPTYLNLVGFGYWPHPFMHHIFVTRIGYPVTLGAIAIGSEFGIWLLLWAAIVAKCVYKRNCTPFDMLSLFAVPIYLFCTFLSPPNTRGGTVDEMWHRPFVWMYFLLAVSVAAWFAQWLEKTWKDQPRLIAMGTIAAGVVLLLIPFREGRSVQHWVQIGAFTHARLDVGFVECADFVRTHATQTDVVQSDLLAYHSFFPALSERRAYLGRELGFWKDYANGTPTMRESQRRSDVLKSMRGARSAADLQGFVKATGIRWYVTQPGDDLRWPTDLLNRPAFESHGFRVYDLAQVPSQK